MEDGAENCSWTSFQVEDSQDSPLQSPPTNWSGLRLSLCLFCTCTTSCWYTHGQDIATPLHHMRLFLGNIDLMPITMVTRLTLGVDSEFMNFDLKLINNPVVSWVLEHKEPSVLMHWKVENRILCYAEPLLWFCRSVECALDIADWYCPMTERWSSFRFKIKLELYTNLHLSLRHSWSDLKVIA